MIRQQIGLLFLIHWGIVQGAKASIATLTGIFSDGT
jgi:hypothetical protein